MFKILAALVLAVALSGCVSGSNRIAGTINVIGEYDGIFCDYRWVELKVGPPLQMETFTFEVVDDQHFRYFGDHIGEHVEITYTKSVPALCLTRTVGGIVQ